MIGGGGERAWSAECHKQQPALDLALRAQLLEV